MDRARLEFLQQLIDAAGPSGYEEPVAAVWRRHLSEAADRIEVDALGSSVAVLNPEGSPRVMLAGHVDELGLQVNYVDDNGFVYFNTIGGHDPAIIPGRRVTVHTRRGPVRGVTGKRAVHMMTAEERKKVPELHEIWIDVGAGDAEAVRELVEVGDAVTYETGFQLLHGGFATSRAFDNKLGAFVVAECLRALAEDRKKVSACVVAVATTQEEVGLRGAAASAFAVDPQVGVAVDVTNPTDHPTCSKEKHGAVALGKGPTITRGANLNPVVTGKLIAAAREHDIPVQLEAVPGRTGTDAGAMQLARGGVACGLLGIPLRYMHTPSEVVHLDDVERSVEILAAFCRGLSSEDDFTPGSE
jgi:putative aminopeptidase FrvX